jgi:DNA-binding GntR family transcriptional regulator
MTSKRAQKSPGKSPRSAMGATSLGKSNHQSAADDIFPPPSRLQVYVAGQILALIRAERMTAGQPLREEALASRLSVSRTSVRGALRILGCQEIVDARPHRGYVLRRNASDLEQAIELPTRPDEKLYLQIAGDYLAGVLPESTTETDFMRRYDASRHLVLATLALLSEEGIIHRGKGREWRFREVLKSSRGREESYELRLMIEPAALLLPTYRIVKRELEDMRVLQLQLLNAAEANPSHRDVFHTDARFHELLAKLSGNGFVLATIRQQNRLRRLLEYQSNLDAKRVRTWCLEHISVIDALLDGDRQLASQYLSKHLQNARRTAAGLKSDKQGRRSSAAEKADV